MAEPIIVGRVSGLFGTRGWVRVHSYTRPLDNLLAYSPWLMRQDGDWQPYVTREARRHHGGLIVAFEGIDDRNVAADLVRQDIAIDRAQLDPVAQGEYYWVDLIGLSVRNRDGVDLGLVRGLLETAAHDVLRVVDQDDHERLIPFVRDVYVLEVDFAAGRMTVDWHVDD